MSISSNRKLEETSFLSKSNSTFIEQMYLKYLNKDANLSAEWKTYFEKLNEETSVAIKELEGPSWGKKTKFKPEQLENIALENQENGLSKNENYNTADFKEASNESIKAIALIRAYRIRGHLLAKLDPLGLSTTEYLDELHPDFYGFKKENYDKPIFLNGTINKNYSSIKEILSFLRKTYCGSVGYEFMHLSDPIERKWFRDRIELDEKGISFTKNGKLAIPVSYTHLTLPTTPYV